MDIYWLIMDEYNIASSFSQPDSLIPSTFNEYFTTNYVAKVQEVLIEY